MKKTNKAVCGYELTMVDDAVGLYIWHKEEGFIGGVRTGLPLKVAKKMAREILKKA